MKKYRVMYRPNEHATEAVARTEEVYADGWRVDYDRVVLFSHEKAPDGRGSDIGVFDIPKTLVMRIQEIP